MSPTKFLPIASSAVALAVLAGCAPVAPATDDDTISIVASTGVYGSIASSIAGDGADVSSIIANASQDPHSFEGNARVQLALSKATIVIENGGGYDDWADTLLAGVDNSDAVVLNVSNLSGYDQEPTAGAFNEHLWYDFPSVAKLADSLADALTEAAPEQAETFEQNAAEFTEALTVLETQASEAAAAHNGTGVAITEPVPLYLLDAMGLENVTPAEFSEAIEEGTDVAPSVLSDTLGLFDSGEAKLLVYSEQTTGPETERILAAAQDAGVPVVPVTETLPEATDDYLHWMTANVDAIAAALG